MTITTSKLRFNSLKINFRADEKDRNILKHMGVNTFADEHVLLRKTSIAGPARNLVV